jgi:hypothetical protein
VFPLVDTVRHLVSRHVTSMQISDYLISNLQMFILYQELGRIFLFQKAVKRDHRKNVNLLIVFLFGFS